VNFGQELRQSSALGNVSSKSLQSQLLTKLLTERLSKALLYHNYKRCNVKKSLITNWANVSRVNARKLRYFAYASNEKKKMF